jgi:hypothetical protein
VKRGKWVLDNILCAPPPPPPPGAETPDLQAVSSKLPMRERLAQHSKDPACAGCHTTMDPVGLAFENYDAFGVWRESDATGRIDSSGELPSGRAFGSAAELAQHLEARRPNARLPLRWALPSPMSSVSRFSMSSCTTPSPAT